VQLTACGYTGLCATANGIVATASNHTIKRKYLGTFGDLHAAARAYNEFSGAHPGDRYYNAVEQHTDADGAPTEVQPLCRLSTCGTEWLGPFTALRVATTTQSSSTRTPTERRWSTAAVPEYAHLGAGKGRWARSQELPLGASGGAC
jgi:hypothetical protein